MGVIRPADVLKYLAEAFPEELLNLPPTTAPAHGQGRGRMTTERPQKPARSDPSSRSSTGSRSASPATPATACSSPAPSSPGPPPSSATTSARCPTSRPRSAPPPARCPASPASRSASLDTTSTRRATQPDVLVAMNPAALKTNVGDLPAGGALIVNSDAFTQQNLNKAGYAANPLTDGSLKQYNVFEIPISTLNERSLEGLDMTSKQVDLTKNFFALGIMFWLYEREMDPTLDWIDDKFGKRPVIAEANKRALKAGYAFGETTEIFHTHYRVAPAKLAPGTYRNITGNEATALGFVAASKLAGRPLFYGSYPITPASDILHQLSGYKNFGVKTFQAEDEIAAIGAAIGASYGGAMGLTASSGPGHRAQERGARPRGHGRAAARRRRRPARRARRPACRRRPSRPTCSRCMLRPQQRLADPGRRPGDAGRVLRLRDRGVADRAEVHDAGRLPVRRVPRHRRRAVGDPATRRPARHRGRQLRPSATTFHPYERDPRRSPGRGPSPARPASSTASAASRRPTSPATSATTPTTTTGCSCCARRRSPGIADDIPPLEVFGPADGDLLILGWGSTYGAIRSAVERLQRRGPQRRPRPPAPPQPVPGQHGGGPPELPQGAHPGGQPRPAVDADPGPVPHRRRGLQPGPRQAVPDRRDRGAGRADPRRVARHDSKRRHDRRGQPPPLSPENAAGHRADPEGLRVRPGSPLVPGLRRLLDPRPDPEG